MQAELSVLSGLAPSLPESGGLFYVIQLTRHGRLPVALHYDPIQSARLPANSAPIASAHTARKESQQALIIAASLFLQSAEKIMSFKLGMGKMEL